eukprot:scaffold34147_cov30-Tisochrysis_lutea.AAC.3
MAVLHIHSETAHIVVRSLRAAAALIRAEGGAVTAEQLAPLLTPTALPPESLTDLTSSDTTIVNEGWVTEALVRLGGEPIVTGVLWTQADGDGLCSFCTRVKFLFALDAS